MGSTPFENGIIVVGLIVFVIALLASVDVGAVVRAFFGVVT